ncbi:MAG: hypothetical protein ACRC2O_07305, partial [Chitinophagaceae bacterium]
MSIHPGILAYGSLSDLPKQVQLQAGGLSLLYEAGFLRYIKAGEIEILRLINLAVRDQNWGTIPFKITNERIEKTEKDFKIEYDAECRQDN